MPIFRFQSSSVVVIGTYNIYILQPSYLALMGVIDSGKKVPVMGDLSSPGLRFETDQMTWIVRPDRFTIETAKWDSACGTKMAEVMENLSWTPVVALGMNIVFRGDHETVAGKLSVPAIEGTMQTTAHAAFEFEGGLINVQLCRTAESQELSLNLHFDLSEFRQDPKLLSKILAERCRSFSQLQRKMIDFSSSLTDIEFQYA